LIGQAGGSIDRYLELLSFGREELIELRIFKRKQPWRDALIATTGLSVFLMAASMLWNTGHQEWAFVVMFTAVWMLLSISWSNIDFTEKSGAILAKIMDHNFNRMQKQIEQLEKDLAEHRASLDGRKPDFGSQTQARSPETSRITRAFSVSSGDE
jgi:hypothetical protein